MKQSILLGIVCAGMALVISCQQGPKFPSDEEMTQKMNDKYGAELANLRELRQMECEKVMSDKINAKLNETTSDEE